MILVIDTQQVMAVRVRDNESNGQFSILVAFDRGDMIGIIRAFGVRMNFMMDARPPGCG